MSEDTTAFRTTPATVTRLQRLDLAISSATGTQPAANSTASSPNG